MPYQYIQLERSGPVLFITMDNPAFMNGMDLNLGPELARSLEEAALDREVRAVVLTGAGGVFSAGGNLKSARDYLEAHPGQGAGPVFAGYSIWVNRVALALAALPQPLVAAVGGAASGAGLGWLLLADLAVVADDAKLVPGFLRVGLAPGAAVSLTLPRLVGRLRATEILLLNRAITPAEALELGIAHKVVPPAEVLPTARELAQGLAQGPARAQAATRRLLRQAMLEDLAGHVEQERRAVMRVADEPEFAQRLSGFFGKRG